MKIAFACPHCAQRLVADVAAAGRTGRCRHCGKPVAVPSGYTLRPVTPVDVPALARTGKTTAAPVGADWDHAELGPAIAFPVAASPRLAPAAKPTPQAVKKRQAVAAMRAGADPQDDPLGRGATVAGLPAVVAVVFTTVTDMIRPSAVGSATEGAAPAPLLVAYRSFFGLLGRLTTWISETSYTVSFVLIILAIAGGMIGRHSFAAFACGAIVTLNLVGLAGDLASLVTLSYRKNPLQGTLFLVPPFTLYYLWTDWRRYRDTIDRMRIPLVTLGVVAAAYVFVPWLRGGSDEEGRFVASVKQAVAMAEEKLAGREGAIDEGLKKARSWLREVPLPAPASPPGGADDRPAVPGGKP